MTAHDTLIARLERDAEWLDGVAEGGDDARIVAHLREAAAAIRALADRERYEKARADKAEAQIKAMREDYREFDDMRDEMVKDYCALVNAIGVNMDAPSAVLDDVRRMKLTLVRMQALEKALRDILPYARTCVPNPIDVGERNVIGRAEDLLGGDQ